MDADEEIVRFQVCQKCHEHHKIDPHSELAYHQAFSACKDILIDQGFKVLKNLPFKYLRKAQDTKASSKRYIDQNTHKIQEFPRRGSFEIYYMNILVFSKLQVGEFPKVQLVVDIVKRIKRSYRKNPLLEGFEAFRDFEIEWKRNQKYLDCVYHYFQLDCWNPTQQSELDKVFTKLEKDKISEKDKKKVIYPYSFYANREKNSKMQRIYCSDFFKKTDKQKTFNHISSKISAYNKTRPPTSPQKSHTFKKTDQTNINSLRGENINSIRLKTIDKKQLKAKNQKNYLSSTHPQQIRPSETRQSTAQNKKTNRMLSSLPENKQNQSTERFFSGKEPAETKNRQSSNQTQRMLKNNSNKLQEPKDMKKERRKVSGMKAKGNGKKLEKEKMNRESLKIQMMDEAIREEVNKILDNFPLSMMESKESFEKMKEGGDDEKKGNNSLMEEWAKERISFAHSYEPATICTKFSQRENFSTFLFENEFLNESSSENFFSIEGFELLHYFQVHALRDMYPPDSLTLFPSTMRPVEGKFLKLVFAVNLLLRKNPLLITRLFENKKFVNPYGNYCIWLKHPNGTFSPTIIDDKFAFSTQKQFIYSKLSYENSIWFVLLEKAFAKVLGGYHHIDEISLGEILGMMLNCPNVEFKNLTPEKLVKILNERIFYSRLAFLYSIPVDSLAIHNKEVEAVRRILGVEEESQDRSIILQYKQQNKEMEKLKKFLVEYNSISLIFFNSNFMMNQAVLPNGYSSSLMSCEIKSKQSNNDCYLIFNNFPSESFTKVTIFKKLSDENWTDQIHALHEQRRYKYIGEILKKENFFFETQLESGEYICLLEAKFEDQDNLYLSIYSEKEVTIADIKLHANAMTTNKSDQFYMKESKVSTKEKKKGKNKSVSRVLVERSLHKVEKDSRWGKSKRSSDFRIRKKFMAMDDEEGWSEKQN